MLKTKTNLTTDKEQYTRSNAATARPLTLVRLAEIWTYDWLNTNGRRKMVMSTITLLNTILHTNHRIDRMTEFKTYKGADTRCNFSCSVARDRISFFGGGEGGVSHDAICCGQLRKSRTRFYFCNCCAQRCKKNLSYTGPLEQLLIAEIAKASLLFSNYVYWPTSLTNVTSHSNGQELRVACAD